MEGWDPLRISIFGLGYVGTVSAGCLADEGHEVFGVDPVLDKVDLINQGKAPIVEPQVGEILERVKLANRLHATQDPAEAIELTDLSFVCVGTPSQANGNLDLKYISRTCEQIGECIRNKHTFHTVVIRSTILPGTMHKIVIPSLEKSSGKRAGIDFGVCNNPEFLREGTAVEDFLDPPKTVIGELDRPSGDLLAKLYENVPAPLIRTDLETAEIIKYADNSWHALKVGFANEIGNLCDEFGIDPEKVMRIFCEDRKLNISAAYLKPGFAFGGSCLPKDLRALAYHAKLHDLELPILSSILSSNEIQIARGVRRILEEGKRRVGVLGCSFKTGTDDLRESPIIEVIERLIGKGFDLRIYDRSVNLSALIGGNRDFILDRIPHISQLMVSTREAVLEHAQTVVLGNNDPEFSTIQSELREGQTLIDLARRSEQNARRLRPVEVH